jgi:AcrR family transcriptional regulator
LKNNENKVHRGELLQAAVKESGMSVETIMKRLGYSSRNTFYRHIKDADLAEAILKRYGKVIRHNFAFDIDFTGPASIVSDNDQPYLPEPKTFEEALTQRNFFWKLYQQKVKDYNDLEETYLALLEKKGEE